jgi:hypothetical protein
MTMRWTTRRWRVALLICALFTVLTVLVGSGWLYYRWTYPYGRSHSCDKGLILALRNYADDHGRAYPTGEATPEASLSLLYPKYTDERVLQGKTVPLDLVKALLERGDRLGPNTCGWHYVDGLTRDDDSRLALFWDKVGLGHWGERLSDGGRTVYFVDGDHEYIPGAKWQEFLREQEKLLAERKKTKHEQKPAVPKT